MRTSGCSVAQLVERRDDAVAQRHVGLQQARRSAPARASAVPIRTQHRRQLAPDFERHVVVAAAPCDSSGTTALPSRASASAASSAELRARRARRSAARRARRGRCGARHGSPGARRRDPRRQSAAAADRAERRPATEPISRAASARRARPSAPRGSRPCASSISARGSRFCAGPGRGEERRHARRGSRSPRSRRAPRSARSGSTPARATDTAAPRSGRRDRDRCSIAGTRSAISSSPPALRMASARRRMSASGCVQQSAQRRMPLARALPLEQTERVADLGRIVGGELRRAARRRPSAR